MTASPPPPGASWQPQPFFSHAIDTVRQIDRVNAEGGIAVAFRPVAGLSPCFAFEGGQSQALSLWRTTSRSGFLSVPKLEVDVVTIRFVTAGAMLRRDQGREHIGRRGLAMMVMFDAMRSEEASADFAAISGTVTRAALAAGHLALAGQDSGRPLPRFAPVVDAAGPAVQTLRQTMERLFGQLKAGIDDADFVFPLLEEVMLYRLLTAWPRLDPDQSKGGGGRRPLRRAKDYIDGNLARKLLLAEVASAAGVGVRRLQLVFRAELGKTPVQFILERRLDRVRADLQAAGDDGTTVGTVAARWGFTHMGDFGRRYRARFGELPSLTRRARGGAAAGAGARRPD